MKVSVLICLLFFSCTSKNNNTDNSVDHPVERISIVESKSENSIQNKSLVDFSYDHKTILSRNDFECNVFVYEGSLVIQLIKDKEEVNISLGGINLYSAKPFAGNFTLASQENENTALVSIYANDTNSGERIKSPIFFDGKLEIISFNEKELRIEIDALGGSYNDMKKTDNWKTIKGSVVAINPQFSQINENIKKLFY